MKAVFSFTLRRFYATILSLFTLLLYAELEDVHGFESNAGVQQQHLVGIRSRRGLSVHGPVVSFAPTNKDDPQHSRSYHTHTSRRNAMADTNTNNQKSSPPQKSNFFGGWAGPFNNNNNNKAATEDASVNGGNDISEARQKEILRSSPEWQEATRIYSLTGDIIGLEDEYLLASKLERSTSGKSNIWEAYKTDESTGLFRESHEVLDGLKRTVAEV